jgi:RNA polymerase sigma-54 factor
VYEIRAASAALAAEPDKPLEPQGVVYIGSTGDLHKRLSDHLRGNSDKPLL